MEGPILSGFELSERASDCEISICFFSFGQKPAMTPFVFIFFGNPVEETMTYGAIVNRCVGCVYLLLTATAAL